MESKKNIKIFNTIILIITVVTLCLSIFYDTAFIPSFLLMSSLFIFGICFYINDEKNNLMRILFIVGILLIFISISYTFLRIL